MKKLLYIVNTILLYSFVISASFLIISGIIIGVAFIIVKSR